VLLTITNSKAPATDLSDLAGVASHEPFSNGLFHELVHVERGVEEGTKAVISANSGIYRERTFNNLRTSLVVEIPLKEFFNSHRRLHS